MCKTYATKLDNKLVLKSEDSQLLISTNYPKTALVPSTTSTHEPIGAVT